MKVFIKRFWLSIVVSVFFIFTGLLSLPKIGWNIQKQTENKAVIILEKKSVCTTLTLNKYLQKILKKMKKINGINYITSSASSHGEIKMFLDEKSEIHQVLLDIREALININLPLIFKRPYVSTDSKTDDPLICVYIYSKKNSLEEVTNYCNDFIKNDIEKGCNAVVEIIGQGSKEIILKPNLKALAHNGIKEYELRKTIEHFTQDSGYTQKTKGIDEYNVSSPAAMKKLEELEELYIQGIPIKELLDISIEKKELLQENWINGDYKAVAIKVYKGAGENPIYISKKVREIINKQLLSGTSQIKEAVVEYKDDTKGLRIIYKKTISSFIEAIILIFIIVLCFLGSLKATFTPIIAIPISIIGAFLPMKLFGCSFNSSTLMAFIIAIGLAVDDAMLMIEKIIADMQKYKDKNLMELVIQSSESIQIPIIVMTMTLACVFMPIVIAKGDFGRALSEFAITLTSCVIISGVVSLTLSPMISARFISYNPYIEKIFHNIEEYYACLLKRILKWKKFFVILTIICFGGTIYLLKKIPRETFPIITSHRIKLSTLTMQNRSMDYLRERAKEIVQLLKTFPEIKKFNVFISTNLELSLKIKKQYSLPELEKKLIFNLKKFFSDMPFVCQEEELYFNLFIYGNDKKINKQTELDLRKFLNLNKKIRSVTGLATKKDELILEVDYKKATEQGVDLDLLSSIISVIANRTRASEFVTPLNKKYKIIIASPKTQEIKKSLEIIWEFPYKNEKHFICPADFVKIKTETQPHTIISYMGFPARQLTVTLEKNAQIGEIVELIKKYKSTNSKIAFDGLARKYEEEQGEMIKIFSLSITFIFLILLAQLDNIKYTLLVMLTAPLAIFGALPFLYRYGTINSYSIIGLITLIGMITKHGIMFVTALQELEESLDINDYENMIINAAKSRLRAVLMTTLAMVLGTIPLIKSSSYLVPLQQMAIVIIPGMTIGTIFTLLILPTIILQINLSIKT